MSLPTILKGFDYLVNTRKITESTIRTFGLAYCDSQGEIYMPADFTGTLPKLDNRFYDSVIFPVEDLFGQVIGVSSRSLVSKSNSPKYLNTTYEKANHLYGLSKVYKDCLKEQVVYVVEGNIDVLQCWQAGLKNVVGMLGSNFSFFQLCLLQRFVKKVVFMSDNDKAGEKFLEKIHKLASTKWYDSDLSFFSIQFPNGIKDPDEFFRQYTLEEFKALPEKEFKL